MRHSTVTCPGWEDLRLDEVRSRDVREHVVARDEVGFDARARAAAPFRCRKGFSVGIPLEMAVCATLTAGSTPRTGTRGRAMQQVAVVARDLDDL
jgi:hypothetical protein